MAGGRPKRYSKEFLLDIAEKFEKYIEETEIPIVAEFAYLINFPRSSLYQFEEFETVLKKCIDKKEANLEKLALTNTVNTSMAIFSLKQLGWTDKVEQNVKSENVVIVDDIK